MVAYSFKKQFVKPIRAGLGLIGMKHDGVEVPCELVIDDGETKARPFDPMRDLDPPVRPKRQTIRARGKRRHARVGETVQLYCGMRTQHCFKIGDGKCNSFSGVYLKWSKWECFETFDVREIEPNVWRRHGAMTPISDLDAFAQADGFGDFPAMREFWLENHGRRSFEGFIIKWEPI